MFVDLNNGAEQHTASTALPREQLLLVFTIDEAWQPTDLECLDAIVGIDHKHDQVSVGKVVECHGLLLLDGGRKLLQHCDQRCSTRNHVQ